MTIKEQIIYLLEQHFKLTQSQLAKYIYKDNKHITYIHYALASLVKEGKILRMNANPIEYQLSDRNISFSSSAFSFVTSDNPYELDYLSYEENSIPALTRKNADFIEAVVGLDSNYSRDTKVIEPDIGFEPEVNSSKSENKYCGSIKYWFVEMQKEQSDFSKCVLGAIISIDRGNSTHLESAIDGRRKMRDIVVSECDSIDKLMTKLNEPLSINHLIVKMSAPMECKGKEGKLRYNLSFASKFCSYAALCLGTQFEYSKYDNVVAKALPEYCFAYLGEKRNKNAFLANDSGGSQKTNRLEYKINIYFEYVFSIERILKVIKKTKKIEIRKEEFDHIIWYGFKGQ